MRGSSCSTALSLAYGKARFVLMLSHCRRKQKQFQRLAHYPWENKANAGETLIATNQKTNTSFARVVLIHEILRLMNKHNQVLLQIPGQSAE
jgi:hypothetical protein